MPGGKENGVSGETQVVKGGLKTGSGAQKIKAKSIRVRIKMKLHEKGEREE